MESTTQSYSRSFWIGLVGFILGGIVSALATFIIFRSGLPSLIINLVPEEQSFIRLVWGILLIFIGCRVGRSSRWVSARLFAAPDRPGGQPKKVFMGWCIFHLDQPGDPGSTRIAANRPDQHL